MIIFFDIETALDIPFEGEDHEARKEKHKDFDFMPEFHQILTITTGVISSDGTVVKNLEGSEKKQIEKFFEIAEKNTLCGFNIKGFDIPFIVKRALSWGIKIPNSLKLFGKKHWEMENIIDLYEIYKHTGYKSSSLDLICMHLRIDSPKEGIDGSQVQQFHIDGKDDEIREYCKRDVEATIEVYKKFKNLNLI